MIITAPYCYAHKNCSAVFSLDLCSVKSLQHFGDLSKVFGMIWRFLPLADPTVDILVSRDLDSRLVITSCFRRLQEIYLVEDFLSYFCRFSLREKCAVSDWITSDLPFHIMRDHPAHGTYILGGMWGAKLTTSTRERYSGMVKNLVQDVSARI